MVFSLLLMVFGIGAFCALIYNGVVYALPVIVGIETALWAIHVGAGSLGGVAVGFLVGGMIFALGQFVLATTRSNIVRFGIVFVFVAPAVIAGYNGILEIAGWGVPSVFWRHIFAISGAAIVGGTALVRLITPIGAPRQPAGAGRIR